MFFVFFFAILTGVWDEKRLETRKPLERKNKKKQKEQLLVTQQPTPPQPSASSVSTSSSSTSSSPSCSIVMPVSFSPKLNKDQEDLITALERAKTDSGATNSNAKVTSPGPNIYLPHKSWSYMHVPL